MAPWADESTRDTGLRLQTRATRIVGLGYSCRARGSSGLVLASLFHFTAECPARDRGAQYPCPGGTPGAPLTRLCRITGRAFVTERCVASPRILKRQPSLPVDGNNFSCGFAPKSTKGRTRFESRSAGPASQNELGGVLAGWVSCVDACYLKMRVHHKISGKLECDPDSIAVKNST